jgi:two-component system sensor kinase FixL
MKMSGRMMPARRRAALAQSLDTAAPSSDPVVESFRVAHGPFVVVAENTRIPMIFTDAGDGAMVVEFANACFLDLAGRPRHAILGQSLAQFFVPELDRESYESFKSALASGRKGEWKLACRSADGTQFWVTAFASPVCNEQNELTHNYVWFSRSDAREQDIVERRDELTALYEDAPGFIAVSEGPDHLFVFANAAYKRFVGKADLVGHTVKEALPGLCEQGIIDLIDTVFETGVAYVGNDIAITFPGEEERTSITRYCDFVYQPIRSSDGSIKGLFCEGYDVTQRHLAAQKMAELQNEVIHLARANAMGTMAATLAHELSQPMTAIGNYTVAGRLSLLRQGHTGIDHAVDAFNAIEDLTRRTGAVIRNLRDLTANRKGQWTNFDLKTAICECIRLIEVAAERPIVIVDSTSEPILVYGDRVQIQQVLINLMKNAYDARDATRPPQIGICATCKNDLIRVCVSDNGTGVSAEAARSLFMFNESTKAEGMGIGLSVSRTIIESHGGRIWLAHTSAAGSEFCFSLAAAQA